MIFVAQHADYFRCQCFIEQLDHLLAVRPVAGRHGAIADVFAGAVANGLDVRKKRFVGAHVTAAPEGLLYRAWCNRLLPGACWPGMGPAYFPGLMTRSEEHTPEVPSRCHSVCRPL